MPRKASRPTSGNDSVLFDEDEFRGVRAVRFDLGNADAAGFVAEEENDSRQQRYIIGALVSLTTASTSAATLDIGVTGTSEASADNLFDGLDVNTAVGLFSLEEDGDGQAGIQLWEPGEFITVSEASGDADGMAGEVIIIYIDP